MVLISLSEFLDSILTVETLSDYFIGLYELINLSGKFIILVRNDADVIIHWVNLDLEIGVILKKSRVGISSTFQFLSHVHQLVFLLSNLHLKLFDSST